jgi:hypothetical protein
VNDFEISSEFGINIVALPLIAKLSGVVGLQGT